MSPKLAIMHGACILAGAVITNLPDELVGDPEIAKPETLAENTMAYRIAHIFFGGLAKAMDPANPNHWEIPAWLEEKEKQAESGGPTGALAGLLLNGLNAAGVPAQLTDLLKGLLEKKPATAPSTSPAALDPALGGK